MSNKTSLDKDFNIATAATADSWPSATGVPAASVYTFGSINKLTETASPLVVDTDIVKSSMAGLVYLKQSTPAYRATNVLTTMPTIAQNVSTFTVPVSVAPTAYRTTLLFITQLASSAGNAALPTSVTGAGMTWSNVTTAIVGTRRVSLYAAVSSSPSTASIVITTAASQTVISALCYSIDGTNFTSISATTSGAAAASTGSVLAYTLPFSAAVDSSIGGINIGFLYRFSAFASPTITNAVTSHWYNSTTPGFAVGDATSGASSVGFTVTAGNASGGLYAVCHLESVATQKVNIPIQSNGVDVSPIGTSQYLLVPPYKATTTTDTSGSTYFYFFGSKDGNGKLLNYYYLVFGSHYNGKTSGTPNVSTPGGSLVKVEAGVSTTIATVGATSQLDRNYEDFWNAKVITSPADSGLFTVKFIVDIPASNTGAPADQFSYTSTPLTKYGDSSGFIMDSLRNYPTSIPIAFNDIKGMSINDISVSNLKPAMQGISRSANW